ncbi:hypothetical protein [Streptosporangium saharense]|uniref:hypothetical protein n=1 Tax=Streptosporangium saharense TaxID=1706840 RepID=UPI00332CBFDA
MLPGSGRAPAPIHFRSRDTTMTDYEQRVIDVLTSTHPGWRYEQLDLPGLPRWWATRYCPLRPDQRRAGARDVLGRTSLHGLAGALARHDEILHNLRY